MKRVCDAIETRVHGKRDVVERVLVAVVAGGHVLLEDVPGVGKTTLARATAAAIGGQFRRIQFTSDLLPGDITGVTILEKGERFRFRPGPIFANVLLADEINRATPKTQSALLEAMSEGQVTVDGQPHGLPPVFVVLATQNPHDDHGTYALPQSQMDRFLIRLSMGYPDRESERRVLHQDDQPEIPDSNVTLEDLMALKAAVSDVKVHSEIEDYLLELVHQTRIAPQLLRGVSPRGTRALHRACRALALLRGRKYVIPEDILGLAGPVLAHRILPRSARVLYNRSMSEEIIADILRSLPAPG